MPRPNTCEDYQGRRMATGSGSGPPAPGGGRVTVNVGALTQAIASAIQEATAPQGRGRTGDMTYECRPSSWLVSPARPIPPTGEGSGTLLNMLLFLRPEMDVTNRNHLLANVIANHVI